MAASNETMGAIHQALATQFLDILTNGIPVEKVDGDGNVTTLMRKPTAAEYGVVVSFLKANDITAVVEENDALTMLKKKMAEKAKARPILPDHLDMH